jgi:hypothetical protein
MIGLYQMKLWKPDDIFIEISFQILIIEIYVERTILCIPFCHYMLPNT